MHTLCNKPFISFSDVPHNKTPKEVMDHLHEWISQLQVHPSHYSRGDTPSRQFLDQKYTTKQLWLIYKEHCMVLKLKGVSEEKFRFVFTHSYNIVSR